MKTWQFPWLLLITTVPAISQAAPNTMPNMQEGLWEITTKIEISGMARVCPLTRYSTALPRETSRRVRVDCINPNKRTAIAR